MTAARIQPDSRAVLVVATVLTALLALVSFLLSFHGLAEAATWANVPGWLAWAIPAYVDGAILVYTLAALVFRARGESARLEWGALAVFAALSVAANGVHAWTAAPAALQVTLGVLLAGLAPVSVLLTTHTVAKLVVAPPTPAEAEVAELEAVAPEVAVEWREAEVPTLATRAEAAERLMAAPPADPLPAPASSSLVDHLEPADALDPIEARNARIRALDDGNRSIRAIAAEVGVSKSTVSRVLNRLPEASAA
ncbi:membrane protein [Microbacterium phage GardenState]|uniref:Membrane protein n=1 Tax=Microbacterium phage GardenState TaxID=2776841 RepID=A0A7L8ZDF5_9CAUD|nr:membrane protein [Microbacterium phage GardenState]